MPKITLIVEFNTIRELRNYLEERNIQGASTSEIDDMNALEWIRQYDVRNELGPRLYNALIRSIEWTWKQKEMTVKEMMLMAPGGRNIGDYSVGKLHEVYNSIKARAAK